MKEEDWSGVEAEAEASKVYGKSIFQISYGQRYFPNFLGVNGIFQVLFCENLINARELILVLDDINSRLSKLMYSS